MIPLPLLTKIPWRLVGWAAFLVAVALAGWRVSSWREAYKALPAAEEALQNEQECNPASRCAERVAALVARQERDTAEAVAGYEREIAGLRNRPERVRTVRLCPPEPDRDLRHAAAAGGTGQGSPAAGLVHAGTGPNRDIGPELYGLAGRADELAAQCRAIIQRDRALAAQE